MLTYMFIAESTINPETSTTSAINQIKTDGKKTRPHIAVSVEEVPATLITALVILGASTKIVWQ